MFQILLMKFQDASIFRKRSARLALVQIRLKGTNEGIGTVFLDNIHWVNPVTERFDILRPARHG